MRKSPSALRVALSALCLFSFLSLSAYGQERELKEHPNGFVQDWSNRHVAFPRVGEIHALIAAQEDPRARAGWQHSIRQDWRRSNRFRGVHHLHTVIHTDWAISLGTGGMAKSMYPAKFGFDPNEVVTAASCTADFIVYSVNVAGGAAQPNIVAFSNIFSGTTPVVGICNRPPGVSDTGVDATVTWAYNVTGTGGGGIVATSPVLSQNGTKVAFVETGGGAAHFHVLAWKTGDGVAAGNLQSVTAGPPKQLTSGFSAVAPVAGTGAVTDLAFGSANDTLSSPFVDYTNDLAYVGNDAGVLFRFKNVFCIGACVPGTSAAPSLDATWGTAGALTIGGTCIGASGKLTGAVTDIAGNVFVGCADGKLYGFTGAGVALTGSPLTVGDGTTFGGIVDPPLVDAVGQLVYVGSGSAAGGTQVVVQGKVTGTTITKAATATLAIGGFFDLHAPAFNDAYFNGTVPNSLLYEVTGDNTAGGIKFYGIQFTGAHVMTGGNPINVDPFAVGGAFEISPVAEFITPLGEDRLFESFLGNLVGNLASFRIDTGFPAGLESFASEGSGTTGIVVDDSSSANQANSIYFGVLSPGTNANSAVKLTQSTLQ